MRLSLSISIFTIIQSLQVYASLVNDVNTDTKRDRLIDSSSTSALRKRANHNNRKGHHNSNKTPSKPANTHSYNDYNDGIHLAIGPSCGFIAANAWAGDINAGIDWRRIQTVVAFGDSFTQVGNKGDGSPPAPIRFVGKNPSAGGRHSNGETWIEQLVRYEEPSGSPRRLLSYATSGSTTDKEIWPSRRWADDFPSQLSRFYANNTELRLDPATTLYVGYFGINDFWSMGTDGNNMQRAGERAVRLLQDLHENAGATNFLWLGIQFPRTIATQYNLAVWRGLRDMHQSSVVNAALDQADAEGSKRINFAFVDTSRFFSAVDESYIKFGYVSNRHCLEGQRSSIDDECENPERTVYYMGAHPSVQTHRILAEFVANVLRKCQIGQKQAYTSLSDYGHGSAGFIGDYIPGYLSGGHLFILASVFVALLAYRPFVRASRRGGLRRGALAMLTPRKPQGFEEQQNS
ncbi:hypothetical protein CPB86DRAFT_60337 [Serendipita vermifera]|nr:hypothetical protein CPB86DRAFT_60337 [Serendipita vermifera]